jgi:hypothetical protein
MTDRDRRRLRLGPYRTSLVRIGRTLTCEARDADVVVVGFSDTPSPGRSASAAAGVPAP